MNYDFLIGEAKGARKLSYCPYSGFAVGAALLGKSGKVYRGCNIESATFTPTSCAERTALFKAVSEGEREFFAIAVVGGKVGEEPLELCPPCGVCRQALAEFCPPDFKILLSSASGGIKTFTLSQLLPESFGKANIS